MLPFFRCVFVCFLCLGISLLAGCGKAAFTGCVACQDGSGGSGDGPAPSPGQAQVTAVNPGSVAAGAAPFMLSVSGLNFTPSTVVMWDSTPLVTKYISHTALQAQVPIALIGGPGTAEIVPSPVGTFNYGVSFAITSAQLSGNRSFAVTKVPVQANDMAWSPTDSRLYLAVPGTDLIRPDTITSLDPKSGLFWSSIATGTEPDKLALSADGNYVYASFDASNSIGRYTLPTLEPDITLSLAIGPDTHYSASDLAVQPTNSHAIAVARIPSYVGYADPGDVVVYDDATPRPQTALTAMTLPIRKFVWNSNGERLYGIDSVTYLELYTLSIDGTGAKIVGKPGVNNEISGGIHFDAGTGYIYTDLGTVLDPESAVTIGGFPVNALQSGFAFTPLMIPDSSLQIAYFLGTTMDGVGTGTYVIEAFDLTHFNLLGTATLPNVLGTPNKFVRWGSNGLAFSTTDASGMGTAGGVYLVSGDFVTHPAQ